MIETKKEHFMRLYEPVHERFERFCKARSYGEVDFKDLMHDTLIVAFEKLDQLKVEGTFLHFLFGICIRILANQRKKKRPEYYDDWDKYKHLKSSETTIEQQLEIENLYKQLGQLEATTRECIILFEISGFSIREIMEIQNLGESAVKQRLSRGRKQLVELMKELDKISA
jgi:RNA polymerase sigma-70 factor (ECF subfamily)